MYQKLKSLIEQDLIFTSMLLCCVAIIAFLLGQASVVSVVPKQAIVSPQIATVRTVELQAPQTSLSPSSSSQSTEQSTTGQFVASKSGTKYHALTCPGAKQIKPENKVFFASAAEAEAAGYSKAANCPGL